MNVLHSIKKKKSCLCHFGERKYHQKRKILIDGFYLPTKLNKQHSSKLFLLYISFPLGKLSSFKHCSLDLITL